MRLIEAPGMTLEPQLAAHAREMFTVLCDPAIYLYENEPPPSVAWLRARFARLESRQSADGQEHWLNWVIRLPASQLIGYVQATVHADGSADVAYVLCSAYWGRGLAGQAVQAMLGELSAQYPVRSFWAVLKRENQRSMRLLDRLGFALASSADHLMRQIEPDELLMRRADGLP